MKPGQSARVSRGKPCLRRRSKRTVLPVVVNVSCWEASCTVPAFKDLHFPCACELVEALETLAAVLGLAHRFRHPLLLIEAVGVQVRILDPLEPGDPGVVHAFGV